MQEQDSFRLVVRRGPQPNQIYELTKEVTTLGRDITNDIVINDREASRHHLRLVRSSGNVTIEDLGSTNGTFVNGKRVSGVTPLQNGDMVGLGETVTLGFEAHRAQSAQSAQPAPSQSPSVPPQQAPVISTPPPQPEIPASQSPYQPPAQQQQQQQQNYPQQQQQPRDPYAPPSDPYQQPQQQGYQSYDEQPQQGDYYGQQQASYGTPPPVQQYSGYDYDPYAMREEEGGSSARWLILGCVVFFFLACACFSIIALVLIDTANLWCEAPIITQIVSALGYCGL